MALLDVARTYRSVLRISQIIQILSRNGFGHLVIRLNLHKHLPLLGRLPMPIPRAEELPQGEETLARRIRIVCEELGPTFVKLDSTN